MTLVKEVLDGLKVVADGIDSIKTITEAVKEGKKYVDKTHPEVKKDLELMVNEMQKNLRLVADATAVLTRFRFAVAPDTGSAELARYNDYFIQQKDKAENLRQHIDDLRGHCHIIREHAMNISGSAGAEGFANLFEKLGLRSRARELELGKKLDELAYEDFQVANMAEAMLTSLEAALLDVQNSLGDDGRMSLENIHNAASLMNEYRKTFEKTEVPASSAAREIEELARDLSS